MTVAEEWDALDDGSYTSVELAELLDTSQRYVSNLRHRWIEKRKNGSTGTLCNRCTFPDEDKFPVLANGLCLPCHLLVHRIDAKTFYESGAWQSVVRWRPGNDVKEDLFDRLRRDVRALLERRDLDELIRERGFDISRVRHFASGASHGADGDTMQEVMKALAIYPRNGKGIGRRYGVPGRLVCHVVRGW